MAAAARGAGRVPTSASPSPASPGPDGGTPEKPVGLVFIALAARPATACGACIFPSERDRVRFQSTQSALEMIRRGLLGLAPL